jgi:hypothetical protein
MALPWSFVSKITNSKHQITNKFQIPNRLKAIVFLFGILNFGHAQRRRLRRVLLFICFWDLLFGISISE